jgi:hypothetical protein
MMTASVVPRPAQPAVVHEPRARSHDRAPVRGSHQGQRRRRRTQRPNGWQQPRPSVRNSNKALAEREASMDGPPEGRLGVPAVHGGSMGRRAPARIIEARARGRAGPTRRARLPAPSLPPIAGAGPGTNYEGWRSTVCARREGVAARWSHRKKHVPVLTLGSGAPVSRRLQECVPDSPPGPPRRAVCSRVGAPAQRPVSGAKPQENSGRPPSAETATTSSSHRRSCSPPG